MNKKTSVSELDLAPPHLFLAGGCSYILPKGKVGERDSKKQRYLCWQKTDEVVYYVCPCGRINQMAVNLEPALGQFSGLFLDGDMMGTYGCEYCDFCKTHLWYVLKDFPVKTIQKKIGEKSSRCPLCRCAKLYNASSLTACSQCEFRWRLPAKPIQIGAIYGDQGGRTPLKG